MRRSLLIQLLITSAASLALAAPAMADQGVKPNGKCKSPKLEQPFAQFGDDGTYSLAPDGGLEQGGDDWSLSGGAAVVRGNEPFAVRKDNDKRSLDLPAGSAGATDVFCVAERHTHARLFATRTGGSPLATLNVTAVVVGADGTTTTHQLASVTGDEWAPTDFVALASQLPELTATHAVDVELRFAPSGNSSWRIDDVYVDPPVRCC
jgi:hypothetical protein